MMQQDLNDILIKIDEGRQDLENIITIRGINDPKVITASQKVDKLLDKYYKKLRK